MLYRAVQSFHAGNRRLVRRGDLVPANDPVIKGREALFAPYDAVEQATAAPGELRNIVRRKAKP